MLDIESYSIRILEKDMVKVPEILEAVTEDEIGRMQANIAKVWRRLADWLSIQLEFLAAAAAPLIRHLRVV